MSARAWLAFAAMCVIWGIPYLFIKVAIDHGVPPASVAFGRCALGAVVLFPLVLRAGSLRSLKGRWLWVTAYALAEITVPFLLIPVGERRIASSLSAIVIATTPLLVALLTLWLDPGERPTRTRLAGLLIGFAGVVVFMGVDVAGRPGELLGAVATLFAAAGYATGPMVLKLRIPQADPRAIMAASLGIAAVVLAPLAGLDRPHAVPDWSAIGSIAVLGVVCSAAGFVLLVWLVAQVGPGRSVVVTYVNPVVAVALGVALLDERPGRGAIAGLVLILTGSWLSTHGRLFGPGLPLGRKRRREGRLVQTTAARTAGQHEHGHRARAGE